MIEKFENAAIPILREIRDSIDRANALKAVELLCSKQIVDISPNKLNFLSEIIRIAKEGLERTEKP